MISSHRTGGKHLNELGVLGSISTGNQGTICRFFWIIVIFGVLHTNFTLRENKKTQK